MNQDQQRQLENRLVAMGLNSIDDPDLCPVFARIVEDFPFDKHWFFRGMLNECEPTKRREMYDAVKPHFVKFQPRSLETYLSEITEQAGRMISHRVMRVEGPRPAAIQIGEEHFVSADGGEGTHTAIKLTCQKCKMAKNFIGESHVDAVIKARKKGWVYDPIKDAETCPKCPAIRQKVGNA